MIFATQRQLSLIINKRMSSNELRSLKSRYSDKDEDNNSSIYNRTIKSELNNLSVQLPQNRKKYTEIERQILLKKANKYSATINLTYTKYPILQQVSGIEGLNWRIQNFGESRNWNIKWCDTGVTNQILQRMNYLQRINHFPAMGIIARKNTLALTLANMKQQYPHQYDFYPRTYLYPNDQAKIRHYYNQSKKRGLLKTFIVKPEAGCQGRGIFLTQNPSEIQKQERCVVQKYISNPLLYKGLKFDLRIYVLVACCQPLRIYLYNEGLVRFSTEQYELPDASNISNYYMHLTNYAINKSNPNYQYNHSINEMTHGHKKSLAQFFKILKDMGYRANSYWSQIKDNIIKTLIAAQPFILANYKSSRPLEPTNNMCFQLLGFDFMIDNQDRCFLLEVNHTPSFTTDTPLDHIIKKNLIRDTLQMMRVSQEQIKIREELERLKQREKYVKPKHASVGRQKDEFVQIINQTRQFQEQAHRGTYEKIFPCKSTTKQQKYEQFLMFSAKSFQSSTRVSKPNQNSTHSTNSLSVSTGNNMVNRIKEVTPKIYSRQNLAKIIGDKSQSVNNKKNIIYSYHNIQHSLPKKVMQTLPTEQSLKFDSQAKKQLSSRNSLILNSKKRLKTQNGVALVLPESDSRRKAIRSQQKPYPHQTLDFLKPIKQSNHQNAKEEKTKNSPQFNKLSKRIRAYKTPLMF